MRMPGLRPLLSELTRRKVVRVVAGYALVAWLVVQVVATTWEALGMPSGTLTAVIVAALVGLPAAALLAWMYEVVPERPVEGASVAGVDLDAVGAAAGLPTGLRRRPPEARPTRSGEVRVPRPLPSPGTPFIGREAELRDLREMLADPAGRLVTVTGAGGVGKTRLALEVARQPPEDLRHGVAYAPLSGLASAELLPPALAEALGITLSRRGDAIVELLDFLREKRLLLVLDNFEHLIEGAALLSRFLEQAPGVRVLVTSRERLGLQAEMLLPLDGLTLARAPGDESDAVRLFVSAAQRADPRFALDAESRACVQRICTMLGGVPLALELAAAWVRTLSCAEIVAELERGLDILSTTAPDLPARHHSLRATFGASWRLLSDSERTAVSRISVFRAAFDRAAALQVAEADAVLLRALVDKSLVTPIGRRFLMLDVVRQYAAERLADEGSEPMVRARHAAYFGEMLGELEPLLLRSDPQALSRAAADVDELRGAWNFALERRDAGALLRALGGLFYFYEARGWAREGAETFGRAADALDRVEPNARDTTHVLARARVEVRRGVFLDRLGEHHEAESLLRSGLAAARDAGDKPEIVFALNRLGSHLTITGKYGDAEQAHQEARRLAEEIRDRRQVGWSLLHLGNVLGARASYDEAVSLYREALGILREQNDRPGIWMTLNNLGVSAAEQQRYEEAQRRFGEALQLQDAAGGQRSAALLHHNVGVLANKRGDLGEAKEQLMAGIEISEEMGYRWLLALGLTELAHTYVRENELTLARATLCRALSTAAAARNYPCALEALLEMARLRRAEGAVDGAAELAALVAVHPASEQELRERAERLLSELGSAALIDDMRDAASPELERVIETILAEDAARVTV